MANDDKNNDEYQYNESDALPTENRDDAEKEEPSFQPPSTGDGAKRVLVNTLVVVIGLVFVIFLYKHFTAPKKLKSDVVSAPAISPPAPTVTPTTPDVTPVTPDVTPTPLPTPTPTPTPIPTPTTSSQEPDNAAMQQKISSIESSQSTMRADITALTKQLTTINTGISSLTEQLGKLNQTVRGFSDTLVHQAEEIAHLTVCIPPKRPMPPPHVYHPPPPRVMYFLQAVIPGRAWLYATNGSTLTVREGTMIPGLGMVKLIDAQQGRVVMSSGHIIRFSPQDS